jgi:hypothetical protein
MFYATVYNRTGLPLLESEVSEQSAERVALAMLDYCDEGAYVVLEQDGRETARFHVDPGR